MKMMKFRLCCILAAAALLLLPGKVFASLDDGYVQNQIEAYGGKMARAEETGYKYKIMDGKQWKRLWSYTYGRWVDPDWTLV